MSLGWPAGFVRVAVGVVLAGHAPSVAAWKTYAAPRPEFTPGAKTRAVVPSLDSATFSANKSPEAPPGFVSCAVGVAVVAHEASPELWYTSAKPVLELADDAPRIATVPSPEIASALPRASCTPLPEAVRTAAGVAVVPHEFSADAWKTYAPPPPVFPSSLTSAVVPSCEIATANPAPLSFWFCCEFVRMATGVEVDDHELSLAAWKMYAPPASVLV